MRVAVLVHDLHGGGAEAVARSWASSLVGGGYEVVFLLYGPQAGAPERGGVPDGVAVHRFPGRSAAARWLLLPVWVRRRVGRLRVDVVLSVLDLSNIAAVVATAGSARPVVISEHATPTLLWRHKGASGTVKRLAARALYRRAEAALGVSHAVATDLRSSLHVPADRVVVLPNPVLDDVPAAPPATAVGRPGPATARRLLVVGRCAPEKQVDRALAVLRELRARGLDWTGCVMGDGPLRAALQRACEEEGLPVEFLGWVSPWQARTRPGDVLLVASDLEGFGNVLVEAAAAGVPSVAASPALGVADGILPGLTGDLSPTTSVTDLADAVLRAAPLEPRTPAVRTWLERFRADAVGERLAAVLEGTVAASRSSRRVVTHVGAHPDAQGGIASVLRTYRDQGVPGWRTRFTTSFVAGAAAWSAGPAARALLRLAVTPTGALGVVHAHVSYGGSFVREGGLAVLAALRGCPVVITVHGSDFERSFARHRRLVLAVFSRATTLVLLSPAHRELLPPDLQRRAVVLTNTVTADDASPSAPPPLPRALFAGEVGRRKGVDVLLAAWPLVRSALPEAHLVIAGPTGDLTPVEAPGVTWAGAVDNAEIRALLHASRVAVLPSRREAMPMFVLEAMASGRPVVATDVGAVADTVGGGGVVVPPDDVTALAEALVLLLAPDGPAASAGAAGRARFQERYGPEEGLRLLGALYEAALYGAALR